MHFSAKKYMGTADGNEGGVLLHVVTDDAEADHDNHERLRELLDIGVKECKIVRPSEEYHDSEQIHITDDQHAPYNEFNK